MELDWNPQTELLLIEGNFAAKLSCDQQAIELAIKDAALKSEKHYQAFFQVTGLANWEKYLRGRDFILIDDAVKSHLRTKLTYRFLNPDTFELLAQRQTSLLEKDIELTLDTLLQQVQTLTIIQWDETWQIQTLDCTNSNTNYEPAEDCYTAIYAEAGSFEFAIFFTPGDLKSVATHCEKEQAQRIKISLLSEELEKGVIRQSRLQVRLNSGPSKDVMRSDFEKFLNSEIPLSA